MLGQSPFTRASSVTADNRIFVYEVTGLRQNDQTDRNNYQVRNSDSTLMQVPFSRMNEEMRRISALGGRIVGIRPLSAPADSPQGA
jgi:hypothetical protein